MSAAETIRKAIEKMESLNGASTRGTWTAAAGFDENRNLEYSLIAQVGFDFFDVLEAVNEDTHMASADADLVEALHGTIDAQITILRHALARAESKIATGGNDRSVWSHEIDAENLAKAILGEVAA